MQSVTKEDDVCAGGCTSAVNVTGLGRRQEKRKTVYQVRWEMSEMRQARRCNENHEWMH